MADGLDMRNRYEQALEEVEEMKRRLREHAQRVAAREKELEELRLELAGRQGRRRTTSAPPGGTERSADAERVLAEAKKREEQARQELALAKAERERLDEREQAIRKVERELAGQRIKLQEERARLGGAVPSEPEPARKPQPDRQPDRQPDGDPPPPTPLPQPPADPDLEPAAEGKRRRSSMLADPQLRKRS